MFILNDLNTPAAVTEWVIEDGLARIEAGRPVVIRQETLVARAWWQRGEKWF